VVLAESRRRSAHNQALTYRRAARTA